MSKEVQSESTLGGDDENDEEKMPTPKDSKIILVDYILEYQITEF